MAGNEQFRRYVEAGTAFLEMTQQRAEAIVKDLVSSGEVARGQAQKAVDWLVERSQNATDELRALVRREVKEQIQALGVATKDDIARLEARLGSMAAPGGGGATQAATTQGATAAKPRARKPPVRKGPAPSTKAAPISKAATTRKRTPSRAPSKSKD